MCTWATSSNVLSQAFCLHCFVHWWSEMYVTSRLSFRHEDRRGARATCHSTRGPQQPLIGPSGAPQQPHQVQVKQHEVFMFSCWSAGSCLWRFAYQGLWHLVFPAHCSWRQVRKYTQSGKSYRPMNAEGERPDRLLLSLLFHLFTLGPYQAHHANTGVQIQQRHN